MRDLKCDVLADLNAGRIVSPKRIKNLIRINKIMIGTYEQRFLGKPYARDAARLIEKLKAEVEAWEAVLAASAGVIDALEDVIERTSPITEGDKRKALENMRTEWGCYAGGVSSRWTRHIRPGAVDLPRAGELEG